MPVSNDAQVEVKGSWSSLRATGGWTLLDESECEGMERMGTVVRSVAVVVDGTVRMLVVGTELELELEGIVKARAEALNSLEIRERSDDVDLWRTVGSVCGCVEGRGG